MILNSRTTSRYLHYKILIHNSTEDGINPYTIVEFRLNSLMTEFITYL